MFANTWKNRIRQGYNERKVNCSCEQSAYILKPVLSVWAEFVNKNFDNFDNSCNIFFSLNRIFYWFFMWKLDPMSGCDILPVFTLPPETVHCSTKDAYTSEITFLAL